MRLIIAGCEYSGTTTLADVITEWIEERLGGPSGVHDHFKGPPEKNLTELEESQFRALGPRLHEMFQRYQIEYHLQPGFFANPDHILVGMHLEDAVYAGMYYGFGGPGEYADRTVFARHIEERLVGLAPDIIEILVKASPEVIRQRMNDAPHHIQIIRDADVEHVLERFEEEHEASLIRHKMEVDTSRMDSKMCLQQVLEVYEPLMTDSDRIRALTMQGRRDGQWFGSS